MRRFISLALLCLPTALLSQQADTISPGMTRAQVVAALGAPATQRGANGFTYMFYPNTCGRACGMQDLVILQKDSVTDAIFRSPNRHYTGTSSSPDEALPGAAPRPATKPIMIQKEKAPASSPPPAAAPTRMQPPAKPTDATPSIPVEPTPLPPAPATPAAPPPDQHASG